MGMAASEKRPPGSLAERFWSIVRSAAPGGPVAADATDPEPRAVTRHVLRILDALAAGEVGDGISQSTISFLALLRQQEAEGDLSYASPEQARGDVVDERSLVFSVGVLIFEELTGRHPFGAVASPRRFARMQKFELGSGV
jgi:serine/threonine protein kinase